MRERIKELKREIEDFNSKYYYHKSTTDCAIKYFLLRTLDILDEVCINSELDLIRRKKG